MLKAKVRRTQTSPLALLQTLIQKNLKSPSLCSRARIEPTLFVVLFACVRCAQGQGETTSTDESVCTFTNADSEELKNGPSLCSRPRIEPATLFVVLFTCVRCAQGQGETTSTDSEFVCTFTNANSKSFQGSNPHQPLSLENSQYCDTARCH